MNKKLAMKKKFARHPLITLFCVAYLLIVYFYSSSQEITLPGEATPIALYSNQTGDDLRKTLKEAILQAKESITIMIFSLTDDQIIDLLKKRSDEGIKINLIQDAVATPNINWRLGPGVTIHKRRHKGLMHDKIVVIDHKAVWLGSVNFTKESFVLHANLLIGIES